MDEVANSGLKGSIRYMIYLDLINQVQYVLTYNYLSLFIPTLMTLQGSDTVTLIVKCNSYNTITSLNLMKMA